MIRSHIAQMVGQIVGHKRSGDVETMPVRLMDARLWEIHQKPEWHMELSLGRQTSGTGDVQIGYPVLALYEAHGEFKEQRAELEQWMRSTNYTMADVLNEQGEIAKGEKSKGVFPKGVFLKVVSGRQLFADYAATRAAEVAHEKWVSDRWKKNMDMFQHVAETSRKLSEEILGMGFTSEDGKPLVQPVGIGSNRVNIDADLLFSLTKMALQVARECDWCGTPDALLPYNGVEGKSLWLCAECHPKVHV